MYTLKNNISFVTMNGLENGLSLTINSYPRILFVAVKNGFLMRLYEHVSGLEVFTCEAFTVDELMYEMSKKGKGLNYELLYSRLSREQAVVGFKRTNTPMRIRNNNSFFESWKLEKTIAHENLPYAYSESERREISNLILLAREMGNDEFCEFLERQINRRKINGKSYVTPVGNLKNSLRFIEEQKYLKKLREQELPYPILYHGKKNDPTFYGFKRLMNESRKRDITKNIPSDIFRLLFGAYFLTTLINNAYGYHLRKLPYLTGIVIGIKAKKLRVDTNRITEYKSELISYCTSNFKNISISVIRGNINTPLILLKSVSKEYK